MRLSVIKNLSNLKQVTPQSLSSSSKAAQQGSLLAFVPTHQDPNLEQVETLRQLLLNSEKNEKSNTVLVVTGAGISTESGLQDYRSEGVGLYARTDRRPMKHMSFVKSAQARKAYWARSFVGFPKWSTTKPNKAHTALAHWERNSELYRPKLSHIITQNVDQLHYKAGSSQVIELHGTLSIIKCLQCSYQTMRLPFQRVLESLNPGLNLRPNEDIVRPDGDIELSPEEVEKFRLAECPRCHSDLLKPDVIFFGDNVPPKRVQHVKNLVSGCDILLVIGSSLDVFSGYRIVLQAKEEGKKVAIVNIGPTRADKLADVKVTSRAGTVLDKILVSEIV
jgi:NAD-dependent deacetylase sirtuin 4